MIEALKKTIQSLEVKISKIPADYGSSNITHKRAQQLAQNNKNISALKKIQIIAEGLLQQHTTGTIPDFAMKISKESEIDFITTGMYPEAVKSTDAEWVVKRKKQRFAICNKLGIKNDNDFRIFYDFLKSFDLSEAEIDKTTEAYILMQYPSIKNIPSFFPTPKPLVKEMIELAEYENKVHPDYPLTTLEPSAGFGSIADEIVKVTSDNTKRYIECCEINTDLAHILQQKGYTVISNDIMNHHALYHRVVMNPPFEKNQDVEHVSYCYKRLKEKGILVSIMSIGWTFANNQKCQEFKDWIGFNESAYEDFKYRGEVEIEHGDKIVYVKMNSDGAFKSSFNSTGVSTLIIKIKKHEN